MGSTPACSARLCPACRSGTLVPVSGWFKRAVAAFHPRLSIIPIFKERGTKTSLSIPLAASPLLRHAEPGAPIPSQESPSRRAKAAVTPRGGQQHQVDLTMPNPLPSGSPEHWAALGLSTLQEHARASLAMSITHNGFPENTEPPPQTSVLS